MDNKDFYEAIFKRKSFHLFKDTGKLSQDDLDDLERFIQSVTPLYPDIRTKITIVRENETTCKRGAEYCILFYSERKPGYLNNIGYIGQQIDLWLAAHDIGSLWFGIGKVSEKKLDDLDYVIMIAIARMDADRFRRDMFKSKRKQLSEIWSGDSLGVADIVRFCPSACNTQPWFTENDGNRLNVYRYLKAGKRGIMPAALVTFYNRIDIGIFLFILETCLDHEGYSYERKLFIEDDDRAEKALVCTYTYEKRP